MEEQHQDTAQDAGELVGPVQRTRRATLKKCARYTGAVIATLALTTPAWASHDQGNQKSQV